MSKSRQCLLLLPVLFAAQLSVGTALTGAAEPAPAESTPTKPTPTKTAPTKTAPTRTAPTKTELSDSSPASHPGSVFPGIANNLQVYYDFEHPAPDDASRELDQGRSHSDLSLVNGGKSMRTRDGAYAASRSSLQFEQVNPQRIGNDDWKAGFFEEAGAPSLAAFNAAKGVTVMGWVKMTGDGPALNTNTPEPDDRYNAIGIAGLLSGSSDGHGVRAMLELLRVDGVLRLVAVGRRLDEGRSQQFAATEDWHTLLPIGQWVHVAASADFSTGTMSLYRNGRPLAGSYAQQDDPWGVGAGGDFATSATNPRGIKIGGSFPQNTQEKNPCHCRMDDLMFLDRAVTQVEVNQQYRWALSSRRASPERAKQSP